MVTKFAFNIEINLYSTDLSEMHEHVMHHLFRPSIFVINILKFSFCKTFIGYAFQPELIMDNFLFLIYLRIVSLFFFF